MADGKAMVRLMEASDVEKMICIQKQRYPEELWESEVPYLKRLEACPAGCFVAVHQELGVIGYIQSHPWEGEDVPSVTVAEEDLAPIPLKGSFFFVFDCAVSEATAAKGVGAALFSAVEAHARRSGYSQMKLVAVRGADAYWARHGFRAYETVPPGCGYGTGSAVKMVKELE